MDEKMVRCLFVRNERKSKWEENGKRDIKDVEEKSGRLMFE